ncbi:hypothetical protein D9757_009802 [Collybiopsis confluens]|uniref:Nephrocystin 3-like N-terminal domain-containing protein n=1 Tax=Collybiopsis confluens TaxID=2823264 RepID=A0A8H5HFU1_9AGAR|nr:hypothetical protein D9757_009802 [Collybiopsis confluens]
MAEQKRSQSARGRKRDKMLDFLQIKHRSKSPAPSVGSGASSRPGTPGTPQIRGRVRDKAFNFFKANHPGSHPSGGSEVSSQLEIPVSSLEVQSEQVSGNQNQQEAQIQAPITATDVGTRSAGVPVLGLNTASSTEGVGPGNNNGEHGQALPGPAEQDPGGENWQEARVPLQMEATDQSRGDTMPADATKAASPSPLHTGTLGSVIDDEHLQARISTSTADKVLSAVEYIAPQAATQGQNKSHGKPAMSGVCKAFVEGWKGLHKTSIDNQDKMQQLFGDIKDYLEIVDEALLQGMRKNRGSKFAKFLVDQTFKLHDMQTQNITKQVITAATISHHLQDMVAGLDKESQKIQTRLRFFVQTDSRMYRMFDMWPLARHAGYNASPTHDICTPETRVEILSQLQDWISDPSSDSPSIFWIRGMAGMGKSTIAKTICHNYSSNRVGDCQLGASFFCSRQSAELRSQQNVIPTIVYQLGKRSDTFWDALAGVDEDAMNDPKNHVSSMLFEPWRKRTPGESSRWLIVIDALDELDGYLHRTLEELGHSSQGPKLEYIQRPSPHKPLPSRLPRSLTAPTAPTVLNSRDQALAHFRGTENSWFDCDHQPFPNASANQTVPEVIQLEGFQILPIAADLPPPAQPTPIPSPTKPDNPLFSDEPIDLDNMPAQPGSSSAPPPPMTTEQIIHALAEQVANLTATVSGRAAAKSSMNKPDLFKGQSSTEARRFLAQFLAWASEQPDLKNNHGKTIKSALGFLTDKEADWATPYLNKYNNGRVPFTGLWPNFVAAFKLRFESVDPEMEARAAIETIHQGKGQSAAETLPKQPTPGNSTQPGHSQHCPRPSPHSGRSHPTCHIH